MDGQGAALQLTLLPNTRADGFSQQCMNSLYPEPAQHGPLLFRLMQLGVEAAMALLNDPPAIAMAGLNGLLASGGHLA